jgi:hypothetical protein
MGRPYTVTFGPWLPDLNDVGVEMPMQWSQTELPVADCNNVYYQDGGYRCIPGLAAVGPTLGTPILQCFTWYDNTAGKEIIFAATANGFYTLVDSTWTQIPVQQNASAGTVGFAVSLGLGTPIGLATWATPTSETVTGSGSSYTFGAVTAHTGYGSPSAYSWSFSGQTGTGSWSVASGQGTATASPAVSGTVANATTTVNFSCLITQGGINYTVSSALSYTQNPPLLRTYTAYGAGTETTPTGYTKVTIEIWGGGGGASYSDGTASWLGGGGGAGYSRSQYTLSGAGGDTINYAVGPGGGVNIHDNGTPGQASTATSGTLAITSMTANGGGGAAANGAGGTASGGNQANATGGNGALAGTGGAAPAGVYANTGATYGHGSAYNYTTNGTSGLVAFYYSS